MQDQYINDDNDSEKTELNLCEELTKKLSSFDKIKQNFNYDEGSYSRIHLQKKTKKGGNKRIIEELSEIL